ncbi:MAG TPA: dihydrofolate reductase family protein [Ktedonobacterales bacterium]|nr:dihydrofolate reductase family protein [Ktedonobacterales bacterium]
MSDHSPDRLEPLITLYEREPASTATLPPVLAQAYGGGLRLPAQLVGADESTARPAVIANFVETIDGIVSYSATPGQAGGGAISGENMSDHMLMGLLRACADVVIFGAGSFRADRGHVHTPAFVFPPYADAYRDLRQLLGKTHPLPLNVVMSVSGELDLDEPTFHTPGLRAVIATTQAGAARLATRSLPIGVDVRAITSAGDTSVDPLATLDLLRREYGVQLALHEGGPRLLAAFLAAGALDELFLTFAPQLAGRDEAHPRPALLEGLAFSPTTAPWATLLSVKRAASHLMLRYRLTASA